MEPPFRRRHAPPERALDLRGCLRMRSVRLAYATAFAAALFVSATTAHADRCTAEKLKATSKTLAGALKCDAKAEAKGTAGGGAACEGKPDGALSTGFAKADAKA